MPMGKIHNLRDFGFRYLVAKYPNQGQPFLVHRQHNFKGLSMVLAEKALEYKNNKLHRREVIVKKHHFVQWGPFGFWARLDKNILGRILVLC